MNAQHTPTPWTAEAADMFGDHTITGPDGTSAVAAVVSNMRPPAEVALNASLIAAAPDLLAALKETAASLNYRCIVDAPYDDDTPDDDSVLGRARAAIAKAEGRS